MRQCSLPDLNRKCSWLHKLWPSTGSSPASWTEWRMNQRMERQASERVTRGSQLLWHVQWNTWPHHVFRVANLVGEDANNGVFVQASTVVNTIVYSLRGKINTIPNDYDWVDEIKINPLIGDGTGVVNLGAYGFRELVSQQAMSQQGKNRKGNWSRAGAIEVTKDFVRGSSNRAPKAAWKNDQISDFYTSGTKVERIQRFKDILPENCKPFHDGLARPDTTGTQMRACTSDATHSWSSSKCCCGRRMVISTPLRVTSSN